MSREPNPCEKQALAALCRGFGIRRLSLFGSVLKRTDRPDSDIDLLVEFEPDAPGLLGMAAIEAGLSGLMGERRVDLRTPQELSRYFLDEVVHAAEAQFAALEPESMCVAPINSGERP
jgi:uncharacterized protein